MSGSGPHSAMVDWYHSLSQRQVLWWSVAAVAVPLAGSALWWVSEQSLNRFAPYQVWARHLCLLLQSGLKQPTLGQHGFLGSDCSLVPCMQYHYRPGTITEYLSQLLSKHAKRRRRKLLQAYPQIEFAS